MVIISWNDGGNRQGQEEGDYRIQYTTSWIISLFENVVSSNGVIIVFSRCKGFSVRTARDKSFQDKMVCKNEPTVITNDQF